MQPALPLPTPDWLNRAALSRHTQLGPPAAKVLKIPNIPEVPNIHSPPLKLSNASENLVNVVLLLSGTE